ncbi:hypothetical protein PHLCEN_2v1450 [Hermanssonia centrifuga]|uniref:Uncharacterized protein n=1 Tax=Hermanssonia centrifuga TaxID=98765 RepID=A0A2R6RZY9_9APHY|nr:hypothetical protein PHLCEN_2v1450 [Hermanssonia centrifuga]
MAERPDALSDQSSQVDTLLTSFKRFIEDYEIHIKAMIERSSEGAPECSILITSRALRTAAESLNTILQIRGAVVPTTSFGSDSSVLQHLLHSLGLRERFPTLTPSRFNLSNAISNVQREIYNPYSQRPWRPSDYPTQADPPTARVAQLHKTRTIGA